MRDQTEETLVRNIARYASSNIYKQVLRILNAFIKPRLLDPEMFGLWNLLSLIQQYALYAHLGSRSAMVFLVPYHDARKEHEKSLAISGSVYYGTFYISLFLFGISLLAAFLLNKDASLQWGLVTLSFLLLCQWYTEYYIACLKSRQVFKPITRANYLDATSTFLLNVLFIYYFGIYGVYLSAVLSGVVVVAYFRAKCPLGVMGSFYLKEFASLIKKGFPIISYNFINFLVRHFDRIIIVAFLGNKQLGYYGIATMVFTFLMQIPGTSREVIEPRLMQTLGEGKSDESYRKYFIGPLINTAYLMPLLIGPLYFILPVFITFLLPKYMPGIFPSQLIILGCYFLALTYIIRGIIVANSWQMQTLLIMFTALLLNITLSIVLLKNELGISGIAASNGITYFYLFFGLMVFLHKRLKYTFPEWKRTLTEICWPFPIMCLLIGILQVTTRAVVRDQTVAAFFNVVAFTIIMLFVINCASRKNPLIKGVSIKEIF